ncbi:MAG: glycosyltransferase family 4 protein [Chloroflexota bacterium]
MRTGLLVYGSLDTVSGGYLYDRKLVDHLKRQGQPVEVFSLPWRNYTRHLGDNLSSSLCRQLRTANLDVLLQDELNHPSLFWLNRRLRVDYPIVSIVHHLRSSEQRPAWQNRLYRLIERSYLHSVDGFVFNSHTTRQVVAQTGVDLKKTPWIVAHPAGDHFAAQVDEAVILQRAMQPGPLRLLFLGNVIPRKGLHTVLQAMQQLPSATCTLQVVGSLQVDRAYIDRLYHIIAAAGLQGRVQFLGSIKTQALAQRLLESQVLVVPSSYEGFGIGYLEGMSFGLPAIATTAGAAGEIITHGSDGFLLPPNDPQSLADCLAGLAAERPRLGEMGAAARQRFLAHPTWEQTAERIFQFLRGVANP